MELADELRLLKSQIGRPSMGHRAFETWDSLKTHLSAEHRVQILTAWNRSLRHKDPRHVHGAIDEIIADIEQ